MSELFRAIGNLFKMLWDMPASFAVLLIVVAIVAIANGVSGSKGKK